MWKPIKYICLNCKKEDNSGFWYNSGILNEVKKEGNYICYGCDLKKRQWENMPSSEVKTTA